MNPVPAHNTPGNQNNNQPTLKVDFADFGGIDKCNNFFVRQLSKFYKVVISDNPDIVIYSDVGGSHLHRLYNCKKIYWTGESTRPDFNECDYSVSPLEIHNPRHIRLPYYAYSFDFNPDRLIKTPGEADTIMKEHRHGCGVVISNIGKRSQYRKEFFNKLAKIMPVFSGGRSLNNIGGPIPPGGECKYTFLKKYRFNLCFENKSLPGYATEKIAEAMLARCIPIYWGDPGIAHEFNPRSFINVHDFPCEEACMKRIIEIETDDDAYHEMLLEPYFHENRPNVYFSEDHYSDFLRRATEDHSTPARKAKHFSLFGRWRLAKRMH